MQKLNYQQMSSLEGGWWRDALDFGAGLCAGTAAVRAVALTATLVVPGTTAVWAGIAVGCLVVGGAAAAT
jgi:hypothetical protein